MSSLDDSLASDTADERRENLRRDVEAMVSLRVSKWNGIELHASAFTPAPPAENTTQQRLSPEAAEMMQREERRRISMASSGGPVRRLSATRE